MEALDIILPIVYSVVGLALIWAIIELAITLKKIRAKSLKVIDDLQPTIDNVQTMVAEIQPMVKKIEPIVDRATLTIDSVNLEILRVDEILEDVTQITKTVTSTMDTVNNVTSAPMDMVTSMTKKFRDKFRPKYASDESVQVALESGEIEPKPTNPIVDFADVAVDAATEAYHEQKEKSAARKESREVKAAKDEAKAEQMNASSEKLSDSIFTQVNQDTAPGDSTEVDVNLEEAVEVFTDITPEQGEEASPEKSEEQSQETSDK